MIARTTTLALVLVLLCTASCKREKAEATGSAPHETPTPAPSGSGAHEHEEGGEHEALPRRVKLSDVVLRDAKVEVALAAREALSETIALPGEIAADPDRLARISSPTAGRIDEVRMKEGAEVKKGDALVVLRVPEIGKVRSSLAVTAGKAAAARANAERLSELSSKRLASEQEALNAKAEADALEVDAKSLKEQLGALGAGASGALSITLRAPISGRVIARDAVVGQPVSSDQTLGSIAALDEVWFLGRVFEKDLGRLSLGASA